MKGQLLHYDNLAGRGTVTGEDGQRYEFAGTEWRSPPQQLQPGTPVDFTPEGGQATALFVGQPAYNQQPSYGAPPGQGFPPPPYGTPEKTPVVAGLLALFLGGFGIHKFYLGYTTEGVIILAVGLGAAVLTVLTLGLFLLLAVPIWMGIGIVTLVEAIIYLTTPQDRFTQTYVVNKKSWF